MSVPQPGSSPATSSPAGDTGRDWTVEVTDKVESVVGAIRDKTTVPITKVARAVVFGLVVATGAVVGVVLVVVALLRLLDVYLPFDPYGRRVWVAYAALGAIFVLVGAFCWSKRSPSTQEVT